jgi:hypothetical protein
MDIEEYIKTSDDALFHYTRTFIAIEKILHTKRFKLSLLKDTNDPREYKSKLLNTVWMSTGKDSDEINDLSIKAQKVIDRILRYECRVLCFCTNEKPTLILSDGSSIEDEHVVSEGWNKARMWSQYGQNHYGICLVLSKNEIKKVLRAKKSQVRGFQANYVQYSQKEGIDLKAITMDGNKLKTKGVEEYSYNHVIENSEEFFFRKHIDYRDEAEYRLVVFDPDNNLEYLDVSSLIKCVIVGDRTPKVYIPLINQMCTYLNIESRKAYWDKGKSHLLLCKKT